MEYIPWYLFSYFLGSISAAIILCDRYGLPDPRVSGSQNPGATNVLRLAGKKMAILALLGDALKGFIAVLPIALWVKDPQVVAITALCVFLGHLYPIFFDFKGGKGVATFLGTLWAANPLWAAIASATWILTALILRYSSAASLTMALSVAALAFFSPNTFIWWLMVALLLWKHRANMHRLWTGQESKLFQK